MTGKADDARHDGHLSTMGAHPPSRHHGTISRQTCLMILSCLYPVNNGEISKSYGIVAAVIA